METNILEKAVSIVDSIYAAEDGNELCEALSKGTKSLGFDIFMLSCRKISKHELMLEPTFSTFPNEFTNDYDHLQWIEADPIAEEAMSADRAFTWSSFQDHYTSVRQQSFIAYLRSLQMYNGLVVPIVHKDGTRSVISVITLTEQPIARSTSIAVEIMAKAAIVKAEMLGLCPDNTTVKSAATRLLSELQLEILKWMAEGKSNLDIATITGVTERSVRYHVSEILRKFGVATRMQAVALFRVF